MKRLWCKFCYAEQPSHEGLAQAIIIGNEFVCNVSVCLVLGDNIFHGNSFVPMLREAVSAVEREGKATMFGYWVTNTECYCVAEFDEYGSCLSIEEKPSVPKSSYVVTRLYFYPNTFLEVAKAVNMLFVASWKSLP